jgi:ribonuclease HI
LELSQREADAGPARTERYARLLKTLARCDGIDEIAETDLHVAPDEVRDALLQGARALHPEARVLKAYIDGASRGNPGKAGAGVVIYDEKGEVLEEESVYLGETTNNVAEYRALLLAIQMAERRGAQELQVYSDSELVVRQVTGRYRVKSSALLDLYKEVKKRSLKLKRFDIRHIPREENRIADSLANQAIDMAPE